MSSHIQRIERVETEVDKLVKNSSTKQDLEALRTEYKKLLVRLASERMCENLHLRTCRRPSISTRWIPEPTSGACGLLSLHRVRSLLTSFTVFREQDLHALSKKAATSVRI
jgi:hypothetical protein